MERRKCRLMAALLAPSAGNTRQRQRLLAWSHAESCRERSVDADQRWYAHGRIVQALLVAGDAAVGATAGGLGSGAVAFARRGPHCVPRHQRDDWCAPEQLSASRRVAVLWQE